MPHRNSAVLRGFSFLSHYAELMNHSQEACYNLGRAYHQLGLSSDAIPYYELVLSQSKREADSDDLLREAAHNLALIYRNSGATELARRVLRNHLTIS